MKTFLASSIFLGMIMLLVFTAVLFNINQTSVMLTKQANMQNNLDNIKNDYKLVAYNLGELIDVRLDELRAETKNKTAQQQEMADGMMQDSEKSNETIKQDMINRNLQVSSEEISNILTKAPTIQLNGVGDFMAIGKAAMAISDNNSYLKIAAINMPKLTAGQVYESWLMDVDSGAIVSAGKMNYEASTSNATLFFAVADDKSNYKKILVTIEMEGESNPKNSPQVLEGTFDANVDFNVVVDKTSVNNIEASQMNIQDLIKQLSKKGDSSSVMAGNFESLDIKALLGTLNK